MMDGMDEWTQEIRRAIQEADAGEFATDAEIAAVRAKWACDEEKAEVLSKAGP
jgi:predicted transcriptional regulator